MAYIHSAGKNKDKDTALFARNLLVFTIPFMFGLLSLFLGRDINWDLKNYHYYNAYAFLENRLDFDIVPAQLQTFINPLADLPFYWLVKYFPSWVAGFVLGIIHGCNLSIVLLIFWKIFRISNKSLKLLIAASLAVISGIAPGFISELGNTMNDNLVSLFVLSPILILVQSSKIISKKDSPDLFQIVMAGLIMGLGVGLKQTIGIFALASALALLRLHVSWLDRFKSLVVYGSSGLIGGIITAGYWSWKLWSRFGNPFFPFYNDIFKSPYFTSTPFNWDLFLPNQPWKYLVWPLLFSRDGSLVNPLQFFDIRFALLYLLCLAWLLLTIRKYVLSGNQKPVVKSEYMFDLKSGNYVLTFFLVSFVLWMIQFSNYRYMISLEILVPLCFLIILERMISTKTIQPYIAISAVVLTLIFFRPFDWGRLAWDSSYFSVDTSRFDTSENAMVIMLGRSPTSYLIPEFPVNFRFVRPEGNIPTYVDSHGNIRLRRDDEQKFFIEIKTLLGQHTGPLYILYNKEEQNIQPEESLLRLGMTMTPAIKNCFLLTINTPDKIEMCQVLK